MAAVLTMYNSSVHEAFLSNIDWDAANNLKMALFTALVFDETDSDFSTVVAANTEHPNANGYTTGGVVMANPTHAIAAGVVTFGTDSVVWTAVGALTAKYAVCYDVASDVVLFCINLDGAGGDVTATDADFTITNASGWFSIDTTP